MAKGVTFSSALLLVWPWQWAGFDKRFGGGSIVVQVTAGCRVSIFLLPLLLFNFGAQPPVKKNQKFERAAGVLIGGFGVLEPIEKPWFGSFIHFHNFKFLFFTAGCTFFSFSSFSCAGIKQAGLYDLSYFFSSPFLFSLLSFPFCFRNETTVSPEIDTVDHSGLLRCGEIP